MVTHKEAVIEAIKACEIASGMCSATTRSEEDAFLFAAMLRAYLDARGLVMVPKEPTNAMADTYWLQTGESQLMRDRVKLRAVGMYRIMLAAAPDPFKEDAE